MFVYTSNMFLGEMNQWKSVLYEYGMNMNAYEYRNEDREERGSES